MFDRLDKAYKAFFSRVKKGAKKAGFPRFKPRQRWDSFKYKQCWDNKKNTWTTCGKPLDDGRRINVPKIGAVKIKFHRPLEGKPKSVQIVLDVDQWYAVYICEVPKVTLPATGSEVGIDVGTTWFAITSDGEFEPNSTYLQSSLKKLRVQSRKLVNAHDLIAHEDLQVSNMVKSNLARSISDVGWAQFFSILSLKAESAGRKVIAVDPRYTSQTCHECGHVCKKNRVSQARFVCVQCGHSGNADVNAAKNILKRARMSPSGVNDKVGNYVVI